MKKSTELTAEMDALIACARRCFDGGLQTNSGGNLSIRVPARDVIIIKPSGIGFNECSHANLQIVHLDGTVEPSSCKPSKDLGFHLGLYNLRDDIGAIVHCHSPWATGFACANRPIPCCTVQSRSKLGQIPLIPLAPGGSAQTENEMNPAFGDPGVVGAILANHGAIGVGKTLMAARHIAEIIEETAHIAFISQCLQANRPPIRN